MKAFSALVLTLILGTHSAQAAVAEIRMKNGELVTKNNKGEEMDVVVDGPNMSTEALDEAVRNLGNLTEGEGRLCEVQGKIQPFQGGAVGVGARDTLLVTAVSNCIPL